ncbi:HAMP domain-containing sensor histidine kinase [Sphingomonas sp. PB2P19]|uniref:sensor histidine kinase n=1 Tax=Sphingomonas rhamnosi TaxID=3096156 RepID=UPI002FC9080B
MIAVKDWAKRHWPQLRLRTILFATLFAVAAMPGVGAVFLRVYENTLVRQTEAELVAQGAALAATAALVWPESPPGRGVPFGVAKTIDPYDSSATTSGVDLSTTPILDERPAPTPAGPVSPDAAKAMSRLQPVLDATRATTLAGMTLLDRNGRIVATPAGGSYAALPEIAAALAGRSTTILRRNGAYRATYRFEWLSRAAAIRVHYARPVVVNGRVVGVLLLSRSARALFKGLYEDRGKILIGVAAIFLALVALSGVISRGVTRPIEQLGIATRAVASGRGRVPDAPVTAAIEIQGLYADFAAMAAAIDRRSHYLRDFAHAVSHEFKTPLAGIRGAIELLQDHPDMAAADRRRFLSNADADANRLALLVTRLMDLARADMAEPGATTTTDPLAVIGRVADTLRDAGVIVSLPADLPSLAVPDSTLEAAVTTLFENSRQAGSRMIDVRAVVTPTEVSLYVSDDGSGIAAGDRHRVFEAFFTTKRTTGGTGLGLAIALSLIEGAGGSLRLENEADSTFVMVMRRAA